VSKTVQNVEKRMKLVSGMQGGLQKEVVACNEHIRKGAPSAFQRPGLCVHVAHAAPPVPF
jgi:hypothetical protein